MLHCLGICLQVPMICNVMRASLHR
jgi:hypothetical protein